MVNKILLNIRSQFKVSFYGKEQKQIFFMPTSLFNFSLQNIVPHAKFGWFYNQMPSGKHSKKVIHRLPKEVLLFF